MTIEVTLPAETTHTNGSGHGETTFKAMAASRAAERGACPFDPRHVPVKCRLDRALGPR